MWRETAEWYNRHENSTALQENGCQDQRPIIQKYLECSDWVIRIKYLMYKIWH